MLELTGERVIPELMKSTNGMLLEHTARYHFSLPYVKGRVLDMACGVGYGSQMVAKAMKKEIREVVAVDYDEDTIAYAKSKYYHPMVKYVQQDITNPMLPSILGSFDTILSFETIEHLPDEKIFLQNIYEMLNTGGTLVLSTPFGQGKGNSTNEPFHYHQFSHDEFLGFFTSYKELEMYYQKGVSFEYGPEQSPPRQNRHYPIGVAVATK